MHRALAAATLVLLLVAVGGASADERLPYREDARSGGRELRPRGPAKTGRRSFILPSCTIKDVLSRSTLAVYETVSKNGERFAAANLRSGESASVGQGGASHGPCQGSPKTGRLPLAGQAEKLSGEARRQLIYDRFLHFTEPLRVPRATPSHR